MIKVIAGEIVTTTVQFAGQIAIDTETGLIEQVGKLGVPASKVDYQFGPDSLIFPGMGDIHVHARQDVGGTQNYKETFLSAAEAAINGGVSFFADMPNNPTPPIDQQSYIDKFKLAASVDFDILLYAGITSKSSPLDFKVPYKLYLGGSTNVSATEGRERRSTMVAPYRGESVSFHCEDGITLINSADGKTHSARRPPEAEIEAIKEALELIERYHLHGTICHCSTGKGMELISAARAKGVDVKVELSPNHLYFNQERVRDGHNYQMNPPIRDRLQQEMLLAALKRGEVDYLATDHAPHTGEEKGRGVSGLTGLDTYGPFACWLIKEHGVSPSEICRICSYNPGKFLNQYIPTLELLNESCCNKKGVYGRGFGEIAQGFLANFTILNTRQSITITADYLKSRCAQSPFLGETLPGVATSMFVRGKSSI
jgi:dihydroorotase